MLLENLIKTIDVTEVIGNTQIEILGLNCDTSLVKKGDLFFCINGSNVDGHRYVKDAINRGAIAIVCNRKLDANVPQIIVDNTRVTMSLIAKEFYGRPSDKMKIIGVTGTNGKTTTCHIISNILKIAGYKTGLIGTLGIFYSNHKIAPDLTTPDPIFLHKIFSDMAKEGVDYVVMEVSAHAAALDKIKGINFEVGVFTNFTQDHLDYFGNMEEYKKAKAKFLSSEYCEFLVYNTDDDFGRTEFLKMGRKCLSYGIEGPSDIFAINIKETINGISFVMNLFDNIFNVKCKMLGMFSAYNCLAAAACCAVLNIDFDDICKGISNTECVSGRIEMIKNVNKNIFVDYAHTPDGLKNVLVTLKRCVTGKLLCLFGCGGNRDKSKRSIMGEIAGEYADFTILTSDNPRYEDPCDIIADIELGIRNKTEKYISIQNREMAIIYALSHMGNGDVLLIAGKGAENYQEILGVKHEFNDKSFVEQYLKERG